MEAVLDRTRVTTSTPVNMTAGNSILPEASRDGEDCSIIPWLSPLDMGLEKLEALRKCSEGTGEWILHDLNSKSGPLDTVKALSVGALDFRDPERPPLFPSPLITWPEPFSGQTRRWRTCIATQLDTAALLWSCFLQFVSSSPCRRPSYPRCSGSYTRRRRQKANSLESTIRCL